MDCSFCTTIENIRSVRHAWHVKTGVSPYLFPMCWGTMADEAEDKVGPSRRIYAAPTTRGLRWRGQPHAALRPSPVVHCIALRSTAYRACDSISLGASGCYSRRVLSAGVATEPRRQTPRCPAELPQRQRTGRVLRSASAASSCDWLVGVGGSAGGTACRYAWRYSWSCCATCARTAEQNRQQVSQPAVWRHAAPGYGSPGARQQLSDSRRGREVARGAVQGIAVRTGNSGDAVPRPRTMRCHISMCTGCTHCMLRRTWERGLPA